MPSKSNTYFGGCLRDIAICDHPIPLRGGDSSLEKRARRPDLFSLLRQIDVLRQRAIHAPHGRGQRYLLCGLHGFNEAIVNQAAAGEVALLDGAMIFDL